MSTYVAMTRELAVVRTTNGGEVTGLVSTYGATFGLDVEVPTHVFHIPAWRVLSVEAVVR